MMKAASQHESSESDRMRDWPSLSATRKCVERWKGGRKTARTGWVRGRSQSVSALSEDV